MKKEINIFERLLVAAILFYGAVVFCLPVAPSEEFETLYPWWAKRLGVGNLVLHELLFIGWTAIYGRGLVTQCLSKQRMPMRRAAIWLIILALWCGFVSMFAPLQWVDLGRTFRLFLMAILMLAVVRWSRHLGNFPLVALISGFFVGTVINLFISYQHPIIVVGVMRLAGQNTPGVAMGIAIHLSAWLYYRSNKFHFRLYAILIALIFGFACAISFSRIGWFTAALGVVAWAYILWNTLNLRIQPKRIRIANILLPTFFVITFLSMSFTQLGQEGYRWIGLLFEQKSERQSDSNDQRWAYVIGTAEILSAYPFGVGYSGFYDAMVATAEYSRGSAAVEDDPLSANPHASILWYATAGGFPGLILFFIVVVIIIDNLHSGIKRSMGKPGSVLFILILLPYLVIGSTVSYLLNSLILLVPAGMVAGWGWALSLEPNSISMRRRIEKH